MKRLTGGAGVHVVYDSVGKDTWEKSLRCLRPRGMLVLFGQSSGPVPAFDAQILASSGSLYFTRPTLGTYVLTREELLNRAGAVLGAMERGDLKLNIEERCRSTRRARARAARLAQDHRQAVAHAVIVLCREQVAALLDPTRWSRRWPRRLWTSPPAAPRCRSGSRPSAPTACSPRWPHRCPPPMSGGEAGVASSPANRGPPHPPGADRRLRSAQRHSPWPLLDGEEITAQRTAAVSALATRLLARADAKMLAIVGTGVQAASHARYVSRVRRFRELVVGGRDRARRAALAARDGRQRGIHRGGGPAGDVICATTHAREPVVRMEWLRPGAHLCSVGLNPGAGRWTRSAARWWRWKPAPPPSRLFPPEPTSCATWSPRRRWSWAS